MPGITADKFTLTRTKRSEKLDKIADLLEENNRTLKEHKDNVVQMSRKVSEVDDKLRRISVNTSGR